VGVTAAAISTFEKGRIPGDPRVAAALAKELGVSFEWFLTGNLPDGRTAEAQHLTLREVEAEYALIRKGLAPEVTGMVGDLETILSSGNLDLIKATRYSLHALARSATPPEPTGKKLPKVRVQGGREGAGGEGREPLRGDYKRGPIKGGSFGGGGPGKRADAG
jgi:transcriptional regulator with XRE-family HTH domain